MRAAVAKKVAGWTAPPLWLQSRTIDFSLGGEPPADIPGTISYKGSSPLEEYRGDVVPECYKSQTFDPSHD